MKLHTSLTLSSENCNSNLFHHCGTQYGGYSKTNKQTNKKLKAELIICSFILSVTHSCLTLCDPMHCRMPGFPVLHHLLKFTQTHVHRVGDAIQPSYLLLSPPPPAFNLSQHQSLFQSQVFTSGGQSIGVSASASVLPMNIQK